MGCGVVPSGSSISLYPSPRGTHPLPLPSIPGGGGGGGGGWIPPPPRRDRRWTSVLCSSTSSFKSRAAAAVEKVPRFVGSFYELLGIEEGGSLDEIKRAYKQMALKYHPDVSPPERAEEYTQRFIEVQEAYETLSDPGRRALYDRDLARGIHFAFSSRRRFDEELEERTQWRDRWQDQLVELKRRSTVNEDSGENLSWGARMRRQTAESSTK